jgi:hypothetical protein
MRSAIPATRNSARIEARQTLPGWTVPTGNNDERRLMQSMIEHLQVTDEIEDARLYRYLFQESEAIRNDLRTVKVFRRVRAKLATYNVPFMQYDEASRRWLYWNDYTLTGLTVWREQHQAQTTEALDEDSPASDDDTAAEDASTDEDADLPPDQDPSGNPNVMAPPNHTQAGIVADTTVDTAVNVHEPGYVPEMLEESPSPPLLPVNAVQRPSLTASPMHMDVAQQQMSQTIPTPSAATGQRMHMDAAQQQMSQTIPTPSAATGQRMSSMAPHPQWFQSPPRQINSQTGQPRPPVLPEHLQRMVTELTDQTDWYESNHSTPTDPNPRQPHASDTIDLTTPSPARTTPPHSIARTLEARLRGSGPDSPGLDADGFTPIQSRHYVASPTPQPHSVPSEPVPRYQILIDSTLETMTEHARALEDAAMERHRLRMERSQEAIKLALGDAVEFIKSTQNSVGAAQQVQIQLLCDQHTVRLADTLDQLSTQVDNLRKEVSGRLFNGDLVTNNAATASPAVSIPGASVPQPTSPTQAPLPPPTSSTHTTSVPETPANTGRWSNVNMDFLAPGAERNHAYGRPASSEHGRFPPQSTQPADNAEIDRYLLKLRNTNTPTVLRTVDRKAVIKFYNAFADFLQQYKVPIKTFDQLRIVHLDDPDTVVYPDTLCPGTPLYTKYTTAVYARLEEDQVLDVNEHQYLGLLTMYSRSRDGYNLLKGLLAATLMTDAKNIAQLSTPPPADSTAHPYEYASQLDEFFQYQTKFDRPYTPREQALMFLQGMSRVSRFTAAAVQLLHDMDQCPPLAPLPTRFILHHIPITLASHPAALTPTPTVSTALSPYAPARINVTRADNLSDRAPPPSDRNAQRRYPPRRPGGNPPRLHKDTQCPACFTYGHEAGECRILPKVAACITYIKDNAPSVQATLQRYKEQQHPANRQTTKAMLIQAVYGHLGGTESEDLDGLIEHLTDSLCGPISIPDENSDHFDGNIFHMHAQYEDFMHAEDLAAALHPAKFPMLDQISRGDAHSQTFPVAPAPTPAESSSLSPCITISVTTVQQRDLADTGASVSATGLKEILHDFTTNTRYEITGYDGQVTRAAGEGFAHVRNDANQTVDKILFVYSPTIAGTIFSLEHHAQTHPHIHKWTQEAIPSTNGGWITFFDQHQHIVSRYPTVRSKGVYFIQDMQFLPSTQPVTRPGVPPAPVESIVQSLATASADPTPARISMMTTALPNDFSHSDEFDGFQAYMAVPPVATLSVLEAEPPPELLPQLTPPTQAVLQFEIWHQRLGHCSERKLRQTQQHVDGIPPFKARIPTVVRCRACDIAKLQRAPKGSTQADPVLQPGQTFQMDIGFFRGPKNLQEVYDRTADAQPKLIESRQGFVCNLLIVDRATRYLWIFPLRSKSISLELIDLFLRTHGLHAPCVKTLRTDGEGSLAESAPFRMLLLSHGYLLEKTATDTSSQNGLAERPHRTLGTMTRCLLFSSQMPIQFWADAIVYAAYIYNRLFHDSIGAVPYNSWTGQRANLKHLKAFGARVLVRRSGYRPTKGDPHYYDGRFLRFTATDRNLVYYDEVTQREKTGRHCTIDEFHYGSTHRPPGACQVLDSIDPHFSQHQPPRHPDDTLLLVPTEDIPNIPLDTIDPQLELLSRHKQSTTARAAPLFHQLSTDDQELAGVLNMWTDTNMYRPPRTVRVGMNRLPTLGFLLSEDNQHGNVYLHGCQEGTSASRLPRWKAELRHAILLTVQNTRIHSLSDVTSALASARSAHQSYVDFTFARIEPRTQVDTDIPQLHYDQLKHIHELLISSVPNPTVLQAQDAQPLSMELNATRAKLKLQADFDNWIQGEWAQLDKYELQNMFGDPIPWPDGATVLPFVWTYLLKQCPLTGNLIYKARATCNGGSRYGRAVTMAETYATCVEQPASRMYWSLTASHNLLAMGADAGNAFAEAPPPLQKFYMRIDEPFRHWWTHCKGRPPLPNNFVLPVNNALQGHPEAPRLWEQHIHHILVEYLHFKATTHEKCLYSRMHPDTSAPELLLRQVDDFSVSAADQSSCTQIIQAIGTHLKAPLNDLGIIRKFNGTNILQTRWYIKVSCEDYLNKILAHHDWLHLKASNQPLPMRSDSAYQRQLEIASRPQTPAEQQHVQAQAGFSYRTSIGELIYALVIARPDISLSTTKLSQYNSNPALVHYQAVKAVFAFLNNTKHDGLIFWRKHPRLDLPDAPLPTPYSSAHNALNPLPTIPHFPLAFSDSDWGSDFSHRRSISGMIIIMSGAAVIYKTRYQRAVALSSTEAEFVSAADTGKQLLYVRSILKDLGIDSAGPSDLMVDNTGAVFMIKAQAPTKRTRHVDIKYFALLQWSESQQLRALPIKTDQNISDSMTKPTGRIKFHQHADLYMGRIPPTYATDHHSHLPPVQLHVINGHSMPVSALIHSPYSALTHPLLALLYESMGG